MRIRRKAGVSESQTRACLSLILASAPLATGGDEEGSRWNTLYSTIMKLRELVVWGGGGGGEG